MILAQLIALLSVSEVRSGFPANDGNLRISIPRDADMQLGRDHVCRVFE